MVPCAREEVALVLPAIIGRGRARGCPARGNTVATLASVPGSRAGLACRGVGRRGIVRGGAGSAGIGQREGTKPRAAGHVDRVGGGLSLQPCGGSRGCACDRHQDYEQHRRPFTACPSACLDVFGLYAGDRGVWRTCSCRRTADGTGRLFRLAVDRRGHDRPLLGDHIRIHGVVVFHD